MDSSILKLRTGELDCNNQQLFFSHLIKGLMVDLRSFMKIRNIPVPHMIMNTGDDTMWLLEKDYDYSKEPCEVTNEQYIYNTVPRCTITIGSLDMVPDQLTNPYTRGTFQYETDEKLYTLSAEFRRLPVKVSVNLKYILDTFRDVLELMQHVCTKLTFIRTFNIVYLGQVITCTYKIPDSFEDQHLTEIRGDTSDTRKRTVEIQLEVESSLPVFEPRTIMENILIAHPIQNLTSKDNEIATRDFASRSGYRGAGFGKHQG
jgi:hypothetical protein